MDTSDQIQSKICKRRDTGSAICFHAENKGRRTKAACTGDTLYHLDEKHFKFCKHVYRVVETKNERKLELRIIKVGIQDFHLRRLKIFHTPSTTG